ncbi:MAG TPA: phytanoyl-CoA dioxygenase family protein [Planctomycetota bacterium]|nr:phytanoyl-CoA dioxygenase family protein [Planctomycetota bacterium]
MRTATAPDTLADLDEHGFAILRGVLAPEVIAGARDALDRLSSARIARSLADGLIADARADLPFERRLIAIAAQHRDTVPGFFREDLHVPEFFALLAAPALLALGERLLGPEIRIYPNYMARPKLPDDQRMLISWHQDAAYTAGFGVQGAVPADALRTLNVWAPLVPARRANGCMQAIPGSHRLGLVPHAPFQEIHLAIADHALAPHLDRAVDLACDPGDAIVFHNLLFHRGLPNTSDTIRWSVDWRLQDATQPTLRPQRGHLLRSRDPAAAVTTAAGWAAATFA